MARKARAKEAPPLTQRIRLEVVDGEQRELRMVPDEANAADLWVAKAPSAFLACRWLKHAWVGEGSFIKLSGTDVGIALECTRCGTRRIDIYKRGELGVQARRYLYPEGYSLPVDTESDRKIPRLMVQDMIFARAKPTGADDEIRELFAKYRKR